MRIMKIQVTDLHGNRLSLGRATARHFVKSLSAAFHKYTNVYCCLNLGSSRGNVVERCFTLPRSSPFAIALTSAEAAELRRRAAKYTLPYFQVQRARMILHAAEGMANDEIAARLDTRREVVSMWRKRFFAERLAGLEEHARPGRPRTFSPRSGRSS